MSPDERFMKRLISTSVLLAFILMGVAPCQGAIMSCGMKMPSARDRCGSCIAGPGGGPVLKAASCCRSEPGQDRSTAPAILSGLAAGSSAPVKTALATIPAPAAASTDAIGALAPAPHGAITPPLSLPHTTVLRL